MCFITRVQLPLLLVRTQCDWFCLPLLAVYGGLMKVMDWKLRQREEASRFPEISAVSTRCCSVSSVVAVIRKHLSPGAHLPTARSDGSGVKRASSLTYQDIKYPLSGARWRQYQYKLMQLTRDL